MNTTEIIEHAAREQCPPFPVKELSTNWVKGFTAGAEWATTDPSILQAILQPFAEWIRTFEALERQNGQWVIESQLSDEQIVKAFIADNKNKQDELSKTPL